MAALGGFDPGLLLAVALCFVIAGTVKGVVGIGLPTTAIGLITLILDPRTTIAIVLLPMLLLNAWQVWRAGNTWAALVRYRLFILVLALSLTTTLPLAGQASDEALLAFTGMVILLFVAVNLSFRVPPLPDRYERAAQGTAGLAAGILGGLTAVWGPPMVIYLTAKRADKDEVVRATGLLILSGSLPLTIGYILQGHLSASNASVSALMVLPGLLGFTVGERLRRHLSPDRFRIVLLLIFFGLGLNLLRRGLF